MVKDVIRCNAGCDSRRYYVVDRRPTILSRNAAKLRQPPNHESVNDSPPVYCDFGQHDSAVSDCDQSDVRPELPFSADMQLVWDPSDRKIRADTRLLENVSPYSSLPSLESRRTRPAVVTEAALCRFGDHHSRFNRQTHQENGGFGCSLAAICKN